MNKIYIKYVIPAITDALNSKDYIPEKYRNDFDLSLNVAVVWQYPTVQKLTDFIAIELKIEALFSSNQNEETVVSSAPPKEATKDIETEVKNLSLEELMKELSSKVD